MASLKSLFRYLSDIGEHEDNTPYLTRNIMAKYEMKKETQNLAVKAENMRNSILVGDEFDEFRSFVAEGYGRNPKLHATAKKFYLLNRERDTAIVSLFLGSGIRVSELVGLNINDYDSIKKTIKVSRKGGNEDIVYISTKAAADLNEYLGIRKKRYRPDKYETALFLPSPESSNFSAGRLKVRAVQALIEKYAVSFGRPYLTVHKLRHSFGSNHYDENKDIEALRKQLGHQDGKTTQIYSHVLSEALQKAVERADS